MNDKNFFQENVIVIIDSNGNIFPIKRIKDEYYHYSVFTRASKLIPNLLDNFDLETNSKSGYKISLFVAAKGYVVFWPINTNYDGTMVVSIPKIPTEIQIQKTKEFMELLIGKEVYVNMCYFNDQNISLADTKFLSESGKFKESYDILMNYFNEFNSNSKNI